MRARSNLFDPSIRIRDYPVGLTIKTEGLLRDIRNGSIGRAPVARQQLDFNVLVFIVHGDLRRESSRASNIEEGQKRSRKQESGLLAAPRRPK